MFTSFRRTRFVLLLAALAAVSGRDALSQAPIPRTPAITSPEKFFGFQMGADKKMARWDKLVEYYNQLAKESPKIKVVNMGPTTMGNPFLMCVISTPANLAKLEQIRLNNLKLADPRGIAEADIRKIVAENKAIVVQSMSMHATEIGGSQMAPELIYDLVSRTDEETQRILDNTIAIMVPSFNPDGEIMVTDWYNKTLGTDAEGSNYPSLYQKYVGHDNNRDAFMTNMVEAQYMAKILFRDWVPEAYVDHHHMGSYNARIYLPPYAEPVRPSADPLLWRELSWYGAHMAYKESEQSLTGAINMAIYSGWGHMGFHWITPFHNIAGMLTESASAKLASPLYIPPDQLKGGPRNLPEYTEQTTFPDPWPGGWWRLRDIVERQKVAAWATLDLAARNRETVLLNMYQKAKRQTERGAAAETKAYVVSANQFDPLTADKMINKLLVQGVEIQQAKAPFVLASGASYPAGSFVVSMAQPKMGVVRWMLGQTFYPDNSFTREKDNSPIRPYDMSTDAMTEFMGVKSDPVGETVKADLVKLTSALQPAGKVAKGSAGYVLDGRLNDAFNAVNLLLDKGVAVRRVDRAAGFTPGDFLVAAAPDAVVAEVAKQTGVDFRALNAPVSTAHDVKRQRVAMYQRYGGGNSDEGWTEFTLEQFHFPYATLMDAELKGGNLNAKYDVIILPSDSTGTLTGERPAAGSPSSATGQSGRGGGGGEGGGAGPQPPPEYRSGFGREGVEALRAFVQKGGTLVTFGGAGSLPIDRFGIPVRNVLAGKSSKEFWCPGSTLRARFDVTNPLTYGMPAQGLATFLADSQAYETLPTDHSERIETLATYADRDVLQSGWLLGEEQLTKKAAALSVRMGQGRVVLIGFRAQHRAQTHGTYKIVFNALLEGAGVPAARSATDGGL